jgi:hypothetical protein
MFVKLSICRRLRVAVKLLSGLVLCQTALAAIPIQVIPTYNPNQIDNAINQLYQAPASHADNLLTRLDFDSAYFIGKPYQLFPLGEGPTGEFDKSPLYRADSFDCLTYVNTVIALAHAKNLSQFQQVFKQVSYKNGQVNFIDRNHFVSSDWNANNAQAGLVRDITAQIHDNQGQSLAQYSNTLIDKPNWYRHMSPSRIKLFQYPGDKAAWQLWQYMQAQAKQVKAVRVATAYIPMQALFTNGQPNMALFNQIPSGSIIEIVRPNLDLTQLIGTHLDVTHIGFAIRTQQGLMFRQASTDKQKVVQVPLITYLKRYTTKPGVTGINVEKVL